jgi:hypothetical protein
MMIHVWQNIINKKNKKNKNKKKSKEISAWVIDETNTTAAALKS